MSPGATSSSAGRQRAAGGGRQRPPTSSTAIRARRRWSFNVGAAIAPDSNIGAGSDERIIYIFGFPFRRNQEELTTSGVGVSVWGGAEYQVPVAERLRLRAGGDFSRREYEGSQFDQLFLATHLGPRWLIDRDTERACC